jgi:hypothetical protein
MGTRGDINNQALNKSSTNQDPFEQGKTDVFWIKSLTHIGKLQKIKIFHDGKGFGSGHLIEYIHVNFEDVTYT